MSPYEAIQEILITQQEAQQCTQCRAKYDYNEISKAARKIMQLFEVKP